MNIQNPKELVGKEVVDVNGNTIGKVDKTWNSWNQEFPGYFFGIRPNQNAKDTQFRGTSKLVPIYSTYIQQVENQITLNKTIDQLARFWNKTVPCGTKTCPTDVLIDTPIYDKNHSRVGIFYTWVETDGTFKNYGCFVDPYLCETWNTSRNTIMPMPIDYIDYVTDTITLTKTLDELKTYWQKYFHH